MTETPVIDAAEVRAALARILATEPFEQGPSLARLLRFAVDQSLAGRRCKLKDAPAGKLRALLSQYYAGEGLRDPVRISIPNDGSAPVFSSLLPPAAPVARRARRLWWILLPFAVVAAIILGWAGSWWHARTASAAIRSVVVLPFVDLSPQKDGEWFCDGITGELIDAMARVPGLHVVAPASASAFRGHADLRTIGRQLGVAGIIEGTIRKAGDRLLVTVRMDRASDGYHLWVESFDRPARDIFVVPQMIADAIASRISIRGAKLPSQRHRPPQQAYIAYLQGRYSFNQSAPEALDKAVERLEESTRIDPDFALAWAWLSIAREYRVSAGMARSNQAMPGSRDAAERAVALNPECVEAHLALGIVKLQYGWDWAGAKEELDRALSGSPGSAFALHWQAHWFETQGRMNEAMSAMQHALALDPLSGVILGDVAAEYLAVNQADRATTFAQKAVELRPNDPAPQLALAGVLWFAGQQEQSRQLVQALSHASASTRLLASELACLSAQQGDPAGARLLLNQAEDLSAEELLPAVAYARLAGAVKDWDRYFLWLQEAVDERDVQLPYLRLSPTAPKSDPRFAAFLEQMNLPAAPAK